MPKKLSLTDDEIKLLFVITGEKPETTCRELAQVYEGVLPGMTDGLETMFQNVAVCGWSRDDLDEVIRTMPLEHRLEALVPATIVYSRNVRDPYLREGCAYTRLEKYFSARQRNALRRAIDEACRAEAQKPVSARKVRSDVAQMISETKDERIKLRRRAAAARLTEKKRSSRPTSAINATPDKAATRDAIIKAAHEIYPDGLREINALAMRLILALVPGAEKDDVLSALKQTREAN